MRDIALTMKKAFFIARTGRPGPVVVDIPKDVTAAKCRFEYPAEIRMRSYNPVVKGHLGQIRKAMSLLLGAKRPVIYSGGGVVLADAAEKLTMLARRLGFPITNTLMGLGGFPATDPQYLGMLGMHGTLEANLAMQHSDVILAVGTRFDDRVIGNPENFASHPRKIIHVDIDPSSISKRVRVDVPIVGNVADVLDDMIKLLEAETAKVDISGWWQQIEEWRACQCMKYTMKDVIMPQFVIEKLWEVTGGDAIITSDVGQHQMWAAQYYKFNKPRRWLNSGGLGTMGVGLPYAMGASLANPDKQVACITGDGSIQMCIQELSTAKQFGLPIKIINLNNRYLGMVRQWQKLFYGKRYAMTNLKAGALSRRTDGQEYPEYTPDFIRLAESYGAKGIRVTEKDQIAAAFEEAKKNTKTPTIIEFIIDPEEMVYPMVKPGGTLADLIMDC